MLELCSRILSSSSVMFYPVHTVVWRCSMATDFLFYNLIPLGEKGIEQTHAYSSIFDQYEDVWFLFLEILLLSWSITNFFVGRYLLFGHTPFFIHLFGDTPYYILNSLFWTIYSLFRHTPFFIHLFWDTPYSILVLQLRSIQHAP